MVFRHLESPEKVWCACPAVVKRCQTEKMSSWLHPALVKWNLYDVLLDDLPLRDGDVVRRALLAAQPCEGAAPGQGERATERHLHGFPTWHLPPFPRLSLQTLDPLRKIEQWGSEVKGVEPSVICMQQLWHKRWQQYKNCKKHTMVCSLGQVLRHKAD